MQVRKKATESILRMRKYLSNPYSRPETMEWPNSPSGDWVASHISNSGDILWVNKGSSESREPVPSKLRFLKGTPFLAAGRPYWTNVSLFVAKKTGPGYGSWGTDCYGRKIYYWFERVPCFDSSDYLFDFRGSGHFWIFREESITHVCFPQDGPFIVVTEDTDTLAHVCWDPFEKAGCLVRADAK